MYTICWTDMNGDHFERVESRRELASIVFKHGLESDSDVLIFTPDAEDYTITVEDLMAAL